MFNELKMNDIKLASTPNRRKTIAIIVVCLILAMNVYVCFIHKKLFAFNTDSDTALLTYRVVEIDVDLFPERDIQRSVWPEQLSDGDRIKEQLVYVPRGYQYEKTPIKKILFYSTMEDHPRTPRMDQEEFIGCPVSQCAFTMDAELGPEVDAVLFRNNYSRPSFERPSDQIWIMWHDDSPARTPWIGDGDAFNWTANYRWDSDVPTPYGYFMKYEPPPQPRKDAENRAAAKTKQVAWFVSDCDESSSDRLAYAAELAKHVSVDVYGACGTLECPRSLQSECFALLERDYKFYLAFENSRCVYHVTDEFFYNALGHGVLPIVMGPSRKVYEQVAPANSFVHVDDFESPERLAEHLRALDADDALYDEYFAWRGTGTVVRDTKFFCRLCAMLHDNGPHGRKRYDDINRWWSGDGVCRGPRATGDGVPKRSATTRHRETAYRDFGSKMPMRRNYG